MILLKLIIFYATCTVLATVPMYFIFHRVYKDGLIGKLGLMGISLTAWSYIFDLASLERDYPYLSNRQLMWVFMFAVFLVWHLFRFHRRVLTKSSYSPECAGDRRKVPDRRYVAQ